MPKAKKTAEATARQMLSWITRTLPRITYNAGDKSVSISAGAGYASAPTDNPADVLAALRMARERDIKTRAQYRRDGREGVWPYNRDAHDREIAPCKFSRPRWLRPIAGGRIVNEMIRRALQYVQNTNGGATVDDFMEDHEPIGSRLWQEMRFPTRLVELDDSSRIRLTEAGRAALNGPPAGSNPSPEVGDDG